MMCIIGGDLLAFAIVSPLFLLAGAALLAVPIVIHILNRRRFKIVQWAAMEFLLRAMKKNRRRLRFEQIVLLATRCLVLLGLGLALSRPMGCADSSLASLAGRRTGLHVFVIDNSYPMVYQANRPGARTQLDQAKIIAKALIERLSSGGESVAIVTSSRPAKAVIASPAYDLHAAQSAVDRIEQSYGGTDEAGALTLARDIAAAEPAQTNKSLYLIDDSTRVEWESNGEAIRQIAHDLADRYKSGITHFNLAKDGQWNQAVVRLSSGQTLVTNWFPADFIADVRVYGPYPEDPTIAWKLDDHPLGGATIVKSGPQATAVTMTAPALSGGIHVISASVRNDWLMPTDRMLLYDPLPIDDTRWRVVDVVNQLKVLIVEGQRGVGGLGSSGAFLDTALNPPAAGDMADASHKHTSYVATERISDLELGGKILGDYRCICLCGVGEIQESEAAQLEKFVEQGGTLMVFMGDLVTAENYNATLYKHHLLPGPLTRRVSVGANESPRHFAFNPHGRLNPLLADFANQENTGMEAAEIYSYWQVDLPPNSKAERVLDFAPPAGTGNEAADPAITVQSLGSGRVLFYATSADPESEWTTFMAHQAYPALMHMLLLGTVSSGDAWMNIQVGDAVVVPASVALSRASVLTDAGHIEFPMEQGADSQGRWVYRSKAMQKPGIYSLSTGTENYKIAVNLPPEEADIRAIDDAQVKKALGDINVRMEGDSVPAEPVAVQQGKDLGWGVMVLVAALLAVECFIAMKFGHHRRR